MAPSATFSTGISTTSGNDTVWATWVDSTASGTTTSNSADAIWTIWASQPATSSGSGSGNIIYSSPPSPPVLSTEEQKELRQARLEKERQLKEKRDAAQRKAEELLCGVLDEGQLEQFKKTKWFFVVSQSGRRYRIRHGWIENIDELDRNDMVIAKHCIHPYSRVPIEDSMLIQKLMLEADEKRFEEIANRTLLSRPRALAA